MRTGGEVDMDAPQIFIWAAIGVLALVAVLVLFVSRGRRVNRLTPLAGLAFAAVVSGIVFSDDRLVGYSLLGLGVVLAVFDILNRSRGSAAT